MTDVLASRCCREVYTPAIPKYLRRVWQSRQDQAIFGTHFLFEDLFVLSNEVLVSLFSSTKWRDCEIELQALKIVLLPPRYVAQCSVYGCCIQSILIV